MIYGISVTKMTPFDVGFDIHVNLVNRLGFLASHRDKTFLVRLGCSLENYEVKAQIFPLSQQVLPTYRHEKT